LDKQSLLGVSIAKIGDLDGDPDGTCSSMIVCAWDKISNTFGNLTENNLGGLIAASDSFGHSIAKLWDLDSDGKYELLVGAPGNNGSAFVLFLDGAGKFIDTKSLPPGTYKIVGNAGTSAGEKLSAIAYFTVVDSASAASIPENNWIAVALTGAIVLFIASKKRKD